MSPRLQTVFMVASLLMMGLIVELIRRRRLREEYSVLWMMLGGAVVLLSLSTGLREGVSSVLGLAGPFSALVFLFGLFMALIALHFTVKISQLTQQVKDLAQELALRDGPAPPADVEQEPAP